MGKVKGIPYINAQSVFLNVIFTRVWVIATSVFCDVETVYCQLY